jgi:serine/threonine protein kinase
MLGIGSYGTTVHKGLYEGNLEVAVKRVLLHNTKIINREIECIRSITHSNVIRYYCNEEDSIFVYIAMELAQCSVADYIKDANKYFIGHENIVIDKKDILLQTCYGLEHLHSKEIIHRDLKPHNILLSLKNGIIKALISDFGISKSLNPHTQTTSLGTIGWIAPEWLVEHNKQERTLVKPKAMDIFSLGCVFHYVFTDGIHPYGDEHNRNSNIMAHKPNVYMTLEIITKNLINVMIKYDPLYRPDIEDVIKYPIFWNSKKCIEFICVAYKRIEYENDIDSIKILEKLSIIFGNWFIPLIDDKIFDQLIQRRKYNENSFKDLLRFIRNKKEHYNELSHDVKKIVGPTMDELFIYINSKFPSLLLFTYIAMGYYKNESAFTMYYNQNSDLKFFDIQNVQESEERQQQLKMDMEKIARESVETQKQLKVEMEKKARESEETIKKLKMKLEKQVEESEEKQQQLKMVMEKQSRDSEETGSRIRRKTTTIEKGNEETGSRIRRKTTTIENGNGETGSRIRRQQQLKTETEKRDPNFLSDIGGLAFTGGVTDGPMSAAAGAVVGLLKALVNK